MKVYVGEIKVNARKEPGTRHAGSNTKKLQHNMTNTINPSNIT